MSKIHGQERGETDAPSEGYDLRDGDFHFMGVVLVRDQIKHSIVESKAVLVGGKSNIQWQNQCTIEPTEPIQNEGGSPSEWHSRTSDGGPLLIL